MPSTVLASSLPWPAILGAVVAVAAVCLWGLFRRGSVADRARHEADDDPVDRPAPAPRPPSPPT